MSTWPEYMNGLVGDEQAKVIAARIGVDASQVSRWKNGRSLPTPENAVRLAEEYDGDPVEALLAAGHVDAGTYSEMAGALGLSDNQNIAIPSDPVTTVSAIKLLTYIANVVSQGAFVKSLESADRGLMERVIDLDYLSTNLLMAALAGAERPVPDNMVQTIEALTRYIHGRDPIVDAMGIFARLLNDEPGAAEEAMRLMNGNRTEETGDDVEVETEPVAPAETGQTQEVKEESDGTKPPPGSTTAGVNPLLGKKSAMNRDEDSDQTA